MEIEARTIDFRYANGELTDYIVTFQFTSRTQNE